MGSTITWLDPKQFQLSERQILEQITKEKNKDFFLRNRNWTVLDFSICI